MQLPLHERVKMVGAFIAMRIRVEQAIVSGRELKIVANRRRKIYKTSPTVRRRDVRVNCDVSCQLL